MKFTMYTSPYGYTRVSLHNTKHYFGITFRKRMFHSESIKYDDGFIIYFLWFMIEYQRFPRRNK